MAVFDDKHQNAPDLPTDDEGDDSSHARAPAASAKGKGKQVVKAPVRHFITLLSHPVC